MKFWSIYKKNLSDLKPALAVSTGRHRLLVPCGQADLGNMQSGSLNLLIVSPWTGFVEYHRCLLMDSLVKIKGGRIAGQGAQINNANSPVLRSGKSSLASCAPGKVYLYGGEAPLRGGELWSSEVWWAALQQTQRSQISCHWGDQQ